MALDGRLDVTVDNEVVAFALTVTNGGADPVELTFPTGRLAEFTVSADDRTVWRWSEGRIFSQAVRSVRLSPGESFTYAGEWADPEPGTFTVVATLEAADASVRECRQFRVDAA